MEGIIFQYGFGGYRCQLSPLENFRGIKIGDHIDDGGDHPAALNIGNLFTADSGGIYRSIHVEEEWQAKQTNNIWNQILTHRFTGTSAYSQDTGTSPYHVGNIGLQLEGTNQNLTIPSYIYLAIQSPSQSAGSGTMSGTITSLYGIYIDNLTKGSTNYAIYTKSGKVRFGDTLQNSAAGVAHGMTSLTSTDVYFDQGINNVNNGGAYLRGLTDIDGTVPLAFIGVVGAITSTVASVSIRGQKKNGTTIQDLAATEQICDFRNNATVKAVMYADGRLFRGSSEYLAASAITTEVLASDTSLTTTYNGTTYKLLARVV